MKSLLERYINGDCEKVYQEIAKLSQDAFLPEYHEEIHQILEETFKRVAYNLQIIYDELKALNYVFNEDPFSAMEEPFVKPFASTDQLLLNVQQRLQPFGYVPVSLHYFYKYVGGVDFSWNYDEQPISWKLADPLQIYALPDVLEIINNEEWLEEFEEIFKEEEVSFLHLSSDVYHKDNISGGLPYSLQLTEKQTIDSKWLFEANETTFINYLRICFEYGGFSGMAERTNDQGFINYLNKIKPQLQPI